MERKDFLKNGFGFLGMALVAPGILKLDDNNAGSACTVTRSETEGPFPTIVPANFQKTDIIGNRTGIPFTIEITMRNINLNCDPASGIIVDIWHCDKDGYYSEYGGASNPFQTKDMRAEHFLRGRQVTDNNGLVTFKSIFQVGTKVGLLIFMCMHIPVKEHPYSLRKLRIRKVQTVQWCK